MTTFPVYLVRVDRSFIHSFIHSGKDLLLNIQHHTFYAFNTAHILRRKRHLNSNLRLLFCDHKGLYEHMERHVS